MEGLTKILNRIKSEADEKVNKIIADANSEATKILDAAKLKTKNECDEIKNKLEVEKTNIKERTEASKELKFKQINLAARRETIDKIFELTKEKIHNLSDDKYVDLIVKIFDKYVMNNNSNKECSICFSAEDLKKISKSKLEEIINNASKKGKNVKLSKEPANIKNGFILDYGDILENCSFDVLIEQNKENLEDTINNILFNK